MPPEPFTPSGSPIAAVGIAVLLAAFVVNAGAFAAGLYGQRNGRGQIVARARYASLAVTALLTCASALLVYAFLAHDFSIRYVAHYSDTSMELFYLLTAHWGGLDGSLLFWAWLLSVASAIALHQHRLRHAELLGYVIAVMAAVTAFFLALLIYGKNPFATFLGAPPGNGKGLNPLLQTPWMVVHPPALYLGYVGMTVPFAFCIAALAAGRVDGGWLRAVRGWVLGSWFALTLGLVLGMLWAYEELGWGGYWAWDPVENAGLLPWLTATALLHSIAVQERRGAFQVWNVVLVIVTFFLTIFGTFMTRSGVVQSVHAFGRDNQLAIEFAAFMVAVVVVAFGLLRYRLPLLRGGGAASSPVSREAVLRLGNWLLLGAALFVLAATMFPTLAEAVAGARITIGPAFFDRWMAPLGVLLLFLTAVGPLLAWGDTPRRSLLDRLVRPAGAFAVTVGAVALLFPRWRVTSPFLVAGLRLPIALLVFGLVAFTIAAAAQDWTRAGTLARRRRFGGSLVHVGFALMCLGFAGGARATGRDVTLTRPGEVFEAGGFRFRYDALLATENDSREMVTAHLAVLRGDREVARLTPARWFYKKSQQPSAEVAIDRRLDQDLYLVLNSFDLDDGAQTANFTLHLQPLVGWVWIGFAVIALGTLICSLPERRRHQARAAVEAA